MASHPGSLFQESWWLDAVSPTSWTQVAVRQDGRPHALASWQRQRGRSGLVRLVPPPLTPQPLWVKPEAGRAAQRLRRDKRLLEGLLEQLPPHDLCQLVLPPELENWLPLHWAGFSVAPRVTYRLEDLTSVDALWAGLSDKTRNAVRRGQGSVEVRRDCSPTALAALVTASLGRQTSALTPGLVERVCTAVVANDAGVALSAVVDGQPVAAALVVWDEDCAYYLLGGANAAGRAGAAQSAVLWEAIGAAAERASAFDFEGTMLAAVEPFFRGFGSTQRTYLVAEHTSRRYAALRAARDLLRAVRA